MCFQAHGLTIPRGPQNEIKHLELAPTKPPTFLEICHLLRAKKHMKFCLKAHYNGKLVLLKYRMDTFGVALLPSAMMKFGSSEGLIRGEEYGQEFYPSTQVPNTFLNWVPHCTRIGMDMHVSEFLARIKS